MTSPSEEIVQVRRLRMIANTDLEVDRRDLRAAEKAADRYRGNDQREQRRLETLVTLLERRVRDGERALGLLDKEIAKLQKQIDRGK